jgi:hypothetical protein
LPSDIVLACLPDMSCFVIKSLIDHSKGKRAHKRRQSTPSKCLIESPPLRLGGNLDCTFPNNLTIELKVAQRLSN